MEDEGADAGFRVHHHAFGEVDADFLRTQEEPDAGLIFEIGASWIAKAVTLATVARSEAVGHGERWRIGEAPIFADSAMQPFGAGFGCFNRQRLKAVRKKIAAGGFCCFGAVAGGVMTVRFTWRGDRIRIFGAGYWRKGKRIYEQQNR